MSVVVSDRHAEADAAVSDCPADAAEADDPECGAAQSTAEQKRRCPPPRFPGADPPFSLTDPAGGGEQQGPCQVGGGVGENVRGVGDDHPAGGTCGHVDVVESDRVVRDDPQTRSRGVEQLRGLRRCRGRDGE